MNKLYGILTYGMTQADMTGNYYAKKHYPVMMTDKGRKLLDILLATLNTANRPMLACALCRISVTSIFKHDVLELDPENTYNEVGRPPAATADDSAYCLYNATAPRDMLNQLLAQLDADIRERLIASPWFDIMAGACLQLLRYCK